jgi:hypothetical protein
MEADCATDYDGLAVLVCHPPQGFARHAQTGRNFVDRQEADHGGHQRNAILAAFNRTSVRLSRSFPAMNRLNHSTF